MIEMVFWSVIPVYMWLLWPDMRTDFVNLLERRRFRKEIEEFEREMR